MTLLWLTTHLNHLGTVRSWPPLRTVQRGKDASLTKGLTHVITLGKFLLRDGAPPDTFQAESCKHNTERKYYKTHRCLCNRAYYLKVPEEPTFHSVPPPKTERNQGSFNSESLEMVPTFIQINMNTEIFWIGNRIGSDSDTETQWHVSDIRNMGTTE